MPSSPDDPGLRSWLPRQRVEAARLDAWQSKTVMDVRTGPGLLSARKGNSVTISLATQAPQKLSPLALVTGTGNESGGGKYTGLIVAMPTTGVAATGNLTSGDVGAAGETVIRIVNLREQGQSSHDLVWDGSRYPVVFLGMYRGTAADGVAVYAIDGMQWKNC